MKDYMNNKKYYDYYSNDDNLNLIFNDIHDEKFKKILEEVKDYDNSYIKLLNNYSEIILNNNNVSCKEQEDALFEGIGDQKRVLLELMFIRKELENDHSIYSEFYDYIIDKLDLLGFTSDVTLEIKAMIVLLDLCLGLPVHLYSAIPLLLDMFKEENIDGSKKLS